MKLFTLVVQRAGELTDIAKGLKQYEGLKLQIDRTLYKYFYSLSQLHRAFPLGFQEVLVNYVKLLEYILDDPSSFSTEYVLRSALICLNSVLRLHSYDGNVLAGKRSPLLANYDELKKQCVNDLYQYFTVEKIENFFNIFLLKLLPKRPFLTNELDPNNLDEFVEIGKLTENKYI